MRGGSLYRVKLGADGRTVTGSPLEYFRTANRYPGRRRQPGRPSDLPVDRQLRHDRGPGWRQNEPARPPWIGAGIHVFRAGGALKISGSMRRFAVAFGVPLVAVCSVYATQSAAPASSVPVDPSASLRASRRRSIATASPATTRSARPRISHSTRSISTTSPRMRAPWKKSPRGCAAARCRRSGCLGRIASTYDAVAGRIEAALDAHSAAHPDPGRPVIHRLNRAEYRERRAGSPVARGRRAARCCRPTIRATASTTSPTCCRCRRRCSSAT